MTEEALFRALLFFGFGSAIAVFGYLLFVPAPYGRFTRTGWGPTVGNRLGWIIMETPAALTILLFIIFGSAPWSPALIAFIVMWEAHYFHRTYIFPFRLHTRGKRMPVMIVCSAIVFNLFNGYVNGRYLGHFAPPYPADWLTSPRFICGAALFAGGLFINMQSDTILMNLRKPGESGYKVPQGGLYRWVSCPNYLGEIIEWTGWAVATWSAPGLLFAVWTIANLAPRALSNHRWSVENIDNYPRDRKALIPFIL